MFTSLFDHGFGVVGYRYVRADYQKGNIIFTIQREKISVRCPVCNSKNVIRHGTLSRWFHTLPIGRKPIYLKTGIPRSECRDVTSAGMKIATFNLYFIYSLRILTFLLYQRRKGAT